MPWAWEAGVESFRAVIVGGWSERVFRDGLSRRDSSVRLQEPIRRYLGCAYRVYGYDRAG